MRGTFSLTLSHGHLVSLRCLLGTVILPWDIRGAKMVWLTGASTGGPKSAQMVLASDVFYKKSVPATADKRESGEGCQNCWQSCETKPRKVGNPPCEYVSPFRDTRRSIRG